MSTLTLSTSDRRERAAAAAMNAPTCYIRARLAANGFLPSEAAFVARTGRVHPDRDIWRAELDRRIRGEVLG